MRQVKKTGKPHWFRVVMSGIVMQAAKLLGMKIFDQRTGNPLGRVLIFPWRGTIIVVPSNRDVYLRPGFLPRGSVRYRSQEIGFFTYSSPDFANVREHDSDLRDGDEGERS